MLESLSGHSGPLDLGQENQDEEYGDSMHNTVVLCSADDAFTLNQVRFHRTPGMNILGRDESLLDISKKANLMPFLSLECLWTFL